MKTELRLRQTPPARRRDRTAGEIQRFHLRLPVELKAKLDRWAVENERSLNWLIIHILQEVVRIKNS